MIRQFTWREFDQSVEKISLKLKDLKVSGIYGIPRGGQCLAVALSHKLNINFLQEPKKNALIVDDIYETGHTLKNFRYIEGVAFYVIFSKTKPIWWESLYIADKNEWIVFPWENYKNAIGDQIKYKIERNSL